MASFIEAARNAIGQTWLAVERAYSSAGEHFVDIEGVTGSIPVTPTISRTYGTEFLKKGQSPFCDRGEGHEGQKFTAFA